EALSSLGTGFITVVLDLYNSGVFNALNKPDPIGSIEYEGEILNFPISQDQFMAPFGSIVFRTVPYNPSMLFTVYVEDSDLSAHDLIWTGNLRFKQFETAFLNQTDTWIDLRSESQQQLV